MVSEDFKQSFMDCQLSYASTLSRMWVIETLACSNQVDVSLLLDLVKKTPEISEAIGRNARELVSLKILESVSGANSVSSASSTKIRFDPSEHCEDALRRILLEASNSNLKTAGLEMLKWDFQPFIAHKRSSLAKCALQQLKDAILTGSHPFLASLKEQSGLPVGNQSEHRVPVDESNCNGITPKLEGSDTNTQLGAASDQLIFPALTNGSHLLHRNLPDKNLLPAKRKINASTENVGGRQLADICTLGEKSRVVGKGKNGPPGDDNNRCTSLKRLVGPYEVLPCEKKVHHWDTEVPNDKFDEQLRQDHDIEEAKGDKEGLCEIKTYEDVDGPNFQEDAPYIGESEEGVDISSTSGAHHNDRTDIATNINAAFSPQFTYSPDSSATSDCKNLKLLADISARILQNSERKICSSSKKNHVGGMGHNEPSGHGNNKRTPSIKLVGLDKVLPHEKQAPHCDMDMPNETFDEEQEQDHDVEDAEGAKEGVRELKINYGGMKPEQNIQRNVPNVDETDDANIASDSDGNHDEKTDIARQKNAFLSSQFAYSQDSWAKGVWRELNRCIKCNKGEKLLVCGSNSSSLVIHESCLGSGASFNTRGSRKQSKEKSCRSYVEQDDCLHKSIELTRDSVKKINKRQRRKKLEYGEAGSSVLVSGDNPPGKAVDSINGIANNLNKDKQEGKWMGQESQSPRVHGQHKMAALANCKSQGENTEISCKKGVLCLSEADLPSGNTCSPSTESTYEEEISVEENENSGASKNIRVRKQERRNSYPAIPQSRRKRVPWTIAEELKLKEGMEKFCGSDNKVMPWKKILEFGADIFHESRTTIDLKDKFRNVCKAIKKLGNSSDEFVQVP